MSIFTKRLLILFAVDIIASILFFAGLASGVRILAICSIVLVIVVMATAVGFLSRAISSGIKPSTISEKIFSAIFTLFPLPVIMYGLFIWATKY